MPKNKNLSKITNYLTADTDNGILSSNVSQTITGSLTVTGNLTAQQFIVSSSVTYLTQSFASGSNRFGNSSDDTHQFTGSVYMSNSLGIGTSSPNFNNFGTALTLLSNLNYGGIEVYGSGSTKGGQIDFGSGNVRYASISGEYESSDNGFLNIRTRRAGTMTDAVRITSAGNVGIGTTTPQRQFVVSNGGAEGLEISTGSGRSTIISYNRSTSSWLPLVLTEGSSNVLIGTTTDNGNKLHVNGGIYAGGAITSTGTMTANIMSVNSAVYTYNVQQAYYGQNFTFTPPNSLNSSSDNSLTRMYMVWVWGANGATEAGCRVWMIAMNGGGTAHTVSQLLGRDANGATSLSLARTSASELTISSNNNAFIKYVSVMQLMTYANG